MLRAKAEKRLQVSNDSKILKAAQSFQNEVLFEWCKSYGSKIENKTEITQLSGSINNYLYSGVDSDRKVTASCHFSVNQACESRAR